MSTTKQALTEYLVQTPAILQGGAFTAAELGADRPFVTPAELWIRSPRLLRAMRARGVPEEMLTGNCSDYDKMTELLFALAYTAGDTLPVDVANDLSYLLGDAAGGEPSVLWQAATAVFAARDITPRALLAAHRAALLPLEMEGPDGLTAFSDTVLPVLDASRLLFCDSPALLLQELSAAYGLPADTLAQLEQLLFVAVARFAAAGSPAVLLDISGYAHFLRPDPYHAGLAFEHLRGGAMLTADERAVLTAQLLRTLGAAACEHDMRLVLRVRQKTEHVMGVFSPVALKRLLGYLAERRVMPDTLLTLAAGELPQGLALLLDAFCDSRTPRLSFGIDGAGASSALLRRSLRFYLSRGAASLLVGITDCDRGFFTNPSLARFARVLAAELSDFAAHDMPKGFPVEALFRTAAAVYSDNAARFYGLV